jgi:hypothetical protein
MNLMSNCNVYLFFIVHSMFVVYYFEKYCLHKKKIKIADVFVNDLNIRGIKFEII